LAPHHACPTADAAPLFTTPIYTPPPPPPTPPPQPPRPHEAAKDDAGARNIRNQATQVVAPPVVQPLVVPPPVITAPVAGVGSAANNGASNLPGPGQGAGGFGNGRGGGGDGGDGDWETPPREIRTNSELSLRDLPEGLFDDDRPGFSLLVRFSVMTDGSAANCRVMRSNGPPSVDAIICRQIEQRFRLRPALDVNGRPVRSTMEKELYFGPQRRR
jgi:protein TonB